MNASRRRAGLVGGGIAATTSALIATVALLGSTIGPATAQVAPPYGTPAATPASPATSASPGPTTSPATPASPATPPSPGASPSNAPVPPAATQEVEEILATVPAELKEAASQALAAAAQTFANSGLTEAQQVAALENVATVVSNLPTTLGTQQVKDAVATASGVAATLTTLSAAQQTLVMTGLSAGIVSSTSALSSAATQKAVVASVNGVVAELAAGKGPALTSDIVKRLVESAAATVSTGNSSGSTGGASTTTSTNPATGASDVRVGGLRPNSPAVVTVTIPAGSAASGDLRAAIGGKVLAYIVNPDGSVTLVLSGTTNELGQLVVSIPASALGASSGAQAQSAMDRALVGVVGTAANGETVVFATPVGAPATPSITARRTPVVPARGAAVLTGTAQPGTLVQLYGRTANGEYRLLRTATVDESGAYSFTVYPHANMRFLVRSTRNDKTVESVSTVVNIRPAVSQAVSRTASQTYRFTGRVSPAGAGVLVNLFRNGANGGSVLVAQTRTAANGTWVINRKFTGTGTFSFFARSARTAATIGGTSSVQRVTIR